MDFDKAFYQTEEANGFQFLLMKEVLPSEYLENQLNLSRL